MTTRTDPTEIRNIREYMGLYPAPHKPAKPKLSWYEWAVYCATGIWVALALVLWLLKPEGENALALFGTTVTVVGAALAFAIYKAQGRQSDEFQRLALGKLTNVQRLQMIALAQQPRTKSNGETTQPQTDPMPDAVAETAEDTQSGEVYIDAVAEKAMNEHGIDVEGHRILDQKYVPLQVIGNLVQAWDAQNEKGNWSVENLLGTSRKMGQGNPSWYVFFVDSQENVVTWRLSSGGQRKTGPTATRLPTASTASATTTSG